MKMSLDILFPDGTQKLFSLNQTDKLWIGRDLSCDIVLSSPGVSRKHVCLWSNGESIVLEDTSTNGTFVDDVQVHGSKHTTQSLSKLKVGQYILEIQPSISENNNNKPQWEKSNQIKSLVTADRTHNSDQDNKVHCNTSFNDVPIHIRRRIHRLLLDYLELTKLNNSELDKETMKPKVVAGLRRITSEMQDCLPTGEELENLIHDLCDEALGLGPLEHLLSDPCINEIMVVDPYNIYAESRGRIEYTGYRFTDNESVRAVIERIVTPLGRRIDESTPLVDARLKDGSRVNAIIPPLAIKGACITIRKFAQKPLTIEDLIEAKTLTRRMAVFLQRTVCARKNVVISGGTGSGKTTLLNVLSAAIPDNERIVTIEDAAELRLKQPHVVSLEARPANIEGKGEYTIRDLLKNALRMRPDRIVVGECRSGEAIDMLQAMNTGHEGSMTTTHSNNPIETINRLETLCLMAGVDLPVRAIRYQISKSIHLIVQQSRFSDGSRRITYISEVTGIDPYGEVELKDIFYFKRTGIGNNGEVLGEFRTSGYLPSFLHEFISQGLISEKDYL